MSDFAAMGAISHRLELYTDTLIIEGAVHGPFRRATDLMNRGDSEFLAMHQATITPLGQPPSTKVMEMPVMVARKGLHFAVDADAVAQQAERQQAGGAAPPAARDTYIQKLSFPCYAITSTYVIYGLCHMLESERLETLLRGADSFIPITKATIYLVVRPDISWQREVAIVNSKTLTAIYLLSQTASAPQAAQGAPKES